MKNIFEFNRFIAFVEEEKLDEAISEETQKTEIFSYTSKGSKGTSASASTDERDKAFKSLKDFYSYAYEKGYPTAPGFDNENKMTLTEWMKTPGFEECEDLIEKAALGGGGKQTIEALVDFKKSKPEEYAMMVMWATHDKFPKGDFEDQDGKRAPLRRKGSKFLYSVMKEIAKPGENLVPVTKSGEPVPEDAAVYLPFDDKTDTSDFFERNSWSLSENFKKWLETNLISKCREQAKTLNPPKGQPKGYLAEIKATGSCSTIPNTVKDENGKELTFKELADKRANEAINYVKKELEKIGIVTDNNTKITLDTDGSNKGKKLTASLGHLPKGTDLTGTSGDIWDGKMESRDKYKHNQTMWVEPLIIFNTTKEPEAAKPKIKETPPEKKEAEVGSKEYTVTIYTTRKRIRINIQIPRFSFGEKRPRSGMGRRGIKCPW